MNGTSGQSSFLHVQQASKDRIRLQVNYSTLKAMISRHVVDNKKEEDMLSHKPERRIKDNKYHTNCILEPHGNRYTTFYYINYDKAYNAY
jgi:hypothetical protein